MRADEIWVREPSRAAIREAQAEVRERGFGTVILAFPVGTYALADLGLRWDDERGIVIDEALSA